MTDQLEDLFAELRAEEIARTRPPGAAAARATLHRRRRRRTVLAGVTVLALTGGVALAVRPAPVPTADEPPAGLLRLTRLADSRIATGGYPYQVAGSTNPLTAGYTDQQYVVPGEIGVHAACAGHGTATLVVRLTPNDVDGRPVTEIRLGHLDVACDAELPIIVSMSVAVTRPGLLSVRVTPDAAAVGRAALAYTGVRSEPSDTAKPEPGEDRRREYRRHASRGLPEPSGDTVAQRDGNYTVAGRATTEAATVRAGYYQVHLTCVGRGSHAWRARLRTGSTTRVLTVGGGPCDPGSGGRVEVRAETGGTLLVDLDPDGAAVAAGTGWGYAITRI